jgi:oligopeptidase A
LSSATATRTHENFVAAYRELNLLLETPTDWTEREVCLAARILDNVAYWMLYLESNYQHETFAHLELWRERFFVSSDVLLPLTDRLMSATVAGQDALLRDRLLKQSRLALSADFVRQRAALEREYERLGVIAGQSEERQAALASRLGFNADGARTALVVYSALRSVPSAQRRSRINQAFLAVRDQTLGEACEAADRIVAVQRDIAALKGSRTPLDASLDGSTIDEQAAYGFINDYLGAALNDTIELADQMSLELGEPLTLPLAAHAGRLLHQAAKGRSTPGIPLEGCLGLAFDVAGRVFGVVCSMTPTQRSDVIRVLVSREGQNLGQIQINQQAAVRSGATPNQTIGARLLPANDSDAGGPVAMISCRFSKRDSTNVLNLQNAHSLLHEFGHAINHVLLDSPAGSPSGLDHLPVERLELLSMWFERWVFSDELAPRCALSDSAREDLAFAIWAKAVEYRLSQVERGALAGVDLLMHGEAALGVRTAYEDLCERHPGLGEHVLLGDLIPYLAWPMLREKPGAYFSYLWAAAESAALHIPTPADVSQSLDARLAPLTACLDPSVPSRPVLADAAIRYYRQPTFGESR